MLATWRVGVLSVPTLSAEAGEMQGTAPNQDVVISWIMALREAKALHREDRCPHANTICTVSGCSDIDHALLMRFDVIITAVMSDVDPITIPQVEQRMCKYIGQLRIFSWKE